MLLPWVLLLVVNVICSPGLGVFGQNFSIPSAWRIQDSALSLSFDERALIIQDAIAELTSRIDTTTGIVDGLSADFPWEAASFLSVLASNDWISGNKTYEVAVANGLQKYQSITPNFFNQTSISFTLAWGLSLFYAYRTYNQPSFLDLTTRIWDNVFPYSVTEAEALRKNHPLRTAAIPSVCSGSSTAGAVFRFTDPSILQVDADSVGRFLALSSYLYETTKNSTYSAAANISATFIQDHLYNGAIALFDIDLATCQHSVGPSFQPSSDNSGVVIEGLSVWANVSGDSTWADLAADIVASTVRFSQWTRADGIVSEGNPDSSDVDGFDNALKGFFIRGLHEAWRRSDPDSPMAKFIESFITVQFSALLDLALTPQSHTFGPVWEGPPVDAFHALPQITALQVLNPALDLARKSNDSSPASTASPSGTPLSTHIPTNKSSARSSSHTGAIVGGVIGGIVALLGTIVLTYFLIRRRRRQSDAFAYPDAKGAPNSGTTTRQNRDAARIEPFVTDDVYSPPPLVFLPSGKRMQANLLTSPVTPSSSAHSAAMYEQSRDVDLRVGAEMSEVADSTGSAIRPILREFMEEMRAMIHAERPHSEISPPQYER